MHAGPAAPVHHLAVSTSIQGPQVVGEPEPIGPPQLVEVFQRVRGRGIVVGDAMSKGRRALPVTASEGIQDRM